MIVLSRDFRVLHGHRLIQLHVVAHVFFTTASLLDHQWHAFAQHERLIEDVRLIGLSRTRCEFEGDVLRLPGSDIMEGLTEYFVFPFLAITGVIYEYDHAVEVVVAAVGDVGHSRHLAAFRQVTRILDAVDHQAVVTRMRGQRHRVACYVGIDIPRFDVLILQPFRRVMQLADAVQLIQAVGHSLAEFQADVYIVYVTFVGELQVVGYHTHLLQFLSVVDSDAEVEHLVLHVAADVPDTEDGIHGREVAVGRAFQFERCVGVHGQSGCCQRLLVGKRLLGGFDARDDLIREVLHHLLCRVEVRAYRQLEVAVRSALPSPVDVEEVSLPVSVDDDLVSVAACDDGALLSQFLIDHVLPFPLRHQCPSHHADALAVVAEESYQAVSRIARVR